MTQSGQLHWKPLTNRTFLLVNGSADSHAHTAVGHNYRAHDEARAIRREERDEFSDLVRVRGAADWSLPAVISKEGLSISADCQRAWARHQSAPEGRGGPRHQESARRDQGPCSEARSEGHA